MRGRARLPGGRAGRDAGAAAEPPRARAGAPAGGSAKPVTAPARTGRDHRQPGAHLTPAATAPGPRRGPEERSASRSLPDSRHLIRGVRGLDAPSGERFPQERGSLRRGAQPAAVPPPAPHRPALLRDRGEGEGKRNLNPRWPRSSPGQTGRRSDSGASRPQPVEAL